MAYTTIDNPELYFQVLTWTGNGATSRALTFDGDENMQPDLVWSKIRSQGYSHSLIDSVRGVTKWISANETSAESDSPSQGFLTSFDSDGFTVEDGSSAIANYNTNTDTYVAWCWKAGTTSGISAASQSITPSAYSINSTSGFGIYKFTGTGSAGTIAHGFGVAPKVVITKNLGTSTNWPFLHSDYTSGAGALNETTAFTGNFSDYFNAVPTSTLINIGTTNGANKSSDAIIMYAFAEKKGFSKFGSYKGNGDSTNGPFVYTGFKPAFLIIKEANGSDVWAMYDNKRIGYNTANYTLEGDGAGAEGETTGRMHLLSNGFRITYNWTPINTSGQTYVYMAFAESPFVNSNGIPNNAR